MTRNLSLIIKAPMFRSFGHLTGGTLSEVTGLALAHVP